MKNKDYVGLYCTDTINYIKENFVNVKEIDLSDEEEYLIEPIPLSTLNLYIDNVNIFFNNMKKYHDKNINKYNMDNIAKFLLQGLSINNFEYNFEQLLFINFAYPNQNYFGKSYVEHAKDTNMISGDFVFNVYGLDRYSYFLNGNIQDTENYNKIKQYKKEIEQFNNGHFFPEIDILTHVNIVNSENETIDNNNEEIFKRFFDFLQLIEYFNIKLPIN